MPAALCRKDVENQVGPLRERYVEVEVEIDMHRVGALHAW